MAPEPLEPWRYVVFDLREPRVRGVVTAVTWIEARKLGARLLRVRFEEFVLAVAPYDGETDEQAVRRVVKDKRKGGRKGAN